MITIQCKNLITGQIFDKIFDLAMEARIFYLKCKHSTKIKVLGLSAIDPTDYEFIVRGYVR